MKCDYCGEETAMPYICGYCGSSFCPKHRLPENHECEGLGELEKESEEIYRGVSEDLKTEPEESEDKEEPEIPFEIREPPRSSSERSSPSFLGGLMSILKFFLFRQVTLMLIFSLILIFVGQQVASGIFGPEYIYYLAPARSTVLSKPWTIITSIFAHGGPSHLLLNCLILFFIGTILERRIGKKKFVYLFLITGAAGSLGQLAVLGSSPNSPILGASGAIFGLLGALTVMSPRLRVLLFFFIPMELWMLTLGYGAIETYLALSGALDGIGHTAHITGLAIGLIFGYKFRKDYEKKFRRSVPSFLFGS